MYKCQEGDFKVKTSYGEEMENASLIIFSPTNVKHLTPMSDQDWISPYNIDRISSW